jgi:PAS domain S-box-containing protein
LINALDIFDEAIIVVDKNKRIILYNCSSEKLFGYENSQVVGKNIDILFPESVQESSAKLDNQFENGNIQNENSKIEFEIIFQHKDGSLFLALMKLSKIKNLLETIITISIINESESNESEKLIVASEIRYRRLFETAKDGILILDADTGMIVDVNPFLIELLGYSKEAFISKNIWEIGLFKDILANKDKFLELQQKEYVRYDDLPLETKFGQKIYVEFVSNVYLVNQEKVIQCNIRDITNKINIQKELIISKNKAEESDRLKTAFLQNMSHEIRTPLNGILGFSALLNSEDVSKKDIKEYTNTIISSGKRLIEIVNNILDISKIQTGQIIVEIENVNIDEVLLELFSLFEHYALSKNNQLSMIYHKDTNISILTDELKFKQILTNLINNSIKFTDKGIIEIGYYTINESIIFYVKDSGIGIPAEFHSKIFDRFVQSNHSLSRGFEGAGLGLSICKGLVEIMGGSIWFDSIETQGTIMYFKLPAKFIENSVNAEGNKIVLKQSKLSSKVLLVEDDSTSIKYIKILLDNFGLEVLIAENGKSAIELIKANDDIDLVLMDMRMPVMDGMEATKIIKELRPDLPIIAQTAYGFVEEKEKILANGCDDYISKPIEKSTLYKLLEKYLK